jgi:hypothetical protein
MEGAQKPLAVLVMPSFVHFLTALPDEHLLDRNMRIFVKTELLL